ncbi:tripartite tricarboxylate transporter substrate binding protein [Zwartia sp.]|uniref:Bug family tripartite tricarboxylate transporter substrate binding protein n=1 Tax=Zwartia sp. TaxID=2978004 RepID=UPI002724627E|nr:tripartite tricarboxylate transporter substrate binding protein [Zwartia sp.]MDO9024055.1 tripartite tricarboxylate transporter substrate binding protein [Zwartia sp.]
MKFTLKHGLTAAVVSVVAYGMIAPDVAHAQAKWPDKQVRMIVPAPPGSAPDGQIRLISQKLSEMWGQPVVVENIVGAGGTIGTDRVAKAAPDGYTFLYNTIGPIAVAESLMGPGKLPYSPAKDLVAVSLATKTPNWITVHPSVPVNNIQELIALAKKSPGKLRYGTAGPGTTQHLTGELLNLVEGIELVGIPYKSSAQMTTDGLGGQIEILIHNTPVLLPHIRAQKLRPLAITSDKRSPAEPQIPTMIESGVKDFEITAWFGFMAPAGTPKPIVDKMSKDVAAVLAMPDVNKRIVDTATEVVGSTPEQYAAFIKSETAKWKDVIIRAKMTPD